jgi:ribose transport system substrate-binding protein
MKRRMLMAAAALGAMVAGSAVPALAKTLNVAVIIKATDSDFWQYMVTGAQNFAHDHPDVKVTVYGPASEADVDQQVAILENVVTRHPDGILIAASSSDAPAPAISHAMSMGIPVVTADNRVNGVKVDAHLATDNLKAGALAADRLVALVKAAGHQPKGKIGLISAYAGVEVLTKRDEGFTKRLAEIAPGLKILPVRYIDNDIQKAMSSATDVISANPDILGFFADNNHSADGTALAIRSSGKAGKIVAVAFDSDPQEVDALREGALTALVVQDPYGMGYKGMTYVVDAINKKTLPAYTDTGVAVITKDTMDQPRMKGLLNPLTLKK